jgi:hypothetical protein
MVAPMPSARNVTVHIEHDIVSLRFKAEDGRDVTIGVAQVAEQLDDEARAILLAWSEDQKKPLLAQDYED